MYNRAKFLSSAFIITLITVPSFAAVSDSISNAWASTKDAITGIFKGAEPCDEAVSQNLIGDPNVTHITKTKLDTKQPEFSDGQNSVAGKCVVSSCAKNYVPNDDRTGCIQSEGPCTPTAENATAGELKNGTCIITECANEYHPSDDGTSCEHAELSEADSKAKVDALRDNAQKMRDKEQSTPNKLLGTAAIAATGVGGMNLMSGLAEQNADDNAEQDMKAYLATFTCDFGQGRNIKGGEREVELPGATVLLPLYTEYKNLAADLKARKSALNMPSGIESEVIFDKAETGLYDDVGAGVTSGAYTSVSRALSDPMGDDAQAWAQQKQDAHDKVKTALTTVGIATVGAIAGNLALNSRNQNQSDKIINDYEKKKRVFKAVQEKVDAVQPDTTPTCESMGATGTWPNCECGATAYFNTDAGCITCENGKQLNADHSGCECPADMPENPTTGQCEQLPPTCILTGLVTPDCECIEHASATDNRCTCMLPYVEMNNQCVCPAETHTIDENGVCVQKQPEATKKVDLNIPGDTFFDNGQSKLTAAGQAFFDNFNDHIRSAIKSATGTDATDADIAEYKGYNTCITGHTDWAKYSGESNKYEKNIKLSQDRAATVEAVLKSQGFTSTASKGKGPFECPHGKTKNPSCRKVTISLQESPCEE